MVVVVERMGIILIERHTCRVRRTEHARARAALKLKLSFSHDYIGARAVSFPAKWILTKCRRRGIGFCREMRRGTRLEGGGGNDDRGFANFSIRFPTTLAPREVQFSRARARARLIFPQYCRAQYSQSRADSSGRIKLIREISQWLGPRLLATSAQMRRLLLIRNRHS